MKSVGVLLNTFEGTDSVFAGGHVHSFEVLARLNDFQITVFAPAYAQPVVDRLLPSASFVAMPSLPAHTPKSFWLFLHRALMSCRALTQLRKCDVVYATSPSLPDIVPAVLAKPRGAVVCIFHIMALPWRRSGPLLRNTLAFAAEFVGLVCAALGCRSVIAGTRYTAERLRQRGFRQAIFVTTNGTGHAAPARHSGRDRHRAVFVGRLHPTKGLSDLLKVWALVRKDVASAKLVIVGDGPHEYRDALLAQARALHLEDAVAFLGRVDDAARSHALASASVFVFPSYEEGWGIAIAEAMAFGLPCVTYALPVFDEVFPSGRLSAPLGDIATFAGHVIALMSDEHLWMKVSGEALALARTFSWDQAAEAERAALLHALGSRRN